MVQVVVGVGSNIEHEKNICSALDQLEAEFGGLLISPVYQSVAETIEHSVAHKGITQKEWYYYNLVLVINADVDAEALRKCLKKIEENQKRQRDVDEVTIDLDLLLYGDWLGELEGNAIPHHDITERAYVLRPLSDLLPELQHPVYRKTLLDLWDEFAGKKNLQSVDFVWRNQLLSAAVCLPVI